MTRLTHSIPRRLAVLTAAVAAFLLLSGTTIHDSRSAAGEPGDMARLVQPTTGPAQDSLRGLPDAGEDPVAVLTAGATATFTATAYCKGSVTASGVAPKRGVAAADPALLPVGSVVQIDSVDQAYSGIYTVMDTGPLIRGHKLDLYMWSCHEALRFGRRAVQVLLLRHGWHPRNSLPGTTQSFSSWQDESADGSSR